MQTNALPHYDMTDIPTGCCPRFDPRGWDGQDLHFRDKLFVRVTTRSIAHVPLNMSGVFTRTIKAMEETGAQNDEDFIVLSRDTSAWSAEHFFAVSKNVPGQEMVRLSGDFITKVFEGPYRNMPKWRDAMAEAAAGPANGGQALYFFYTTCPKCAKYYGKNYVVGVARTS